MATLHIEHAISDFEVWQQAFERFDRARQEAGVRSFQVRRPVDDAQYVVVDLDFATVEEAARFLSFLEENVWSSPTTSPALAATPEARILDQALTG